VLWRFFDSYPFVAFQGEGASATTELKHGFKIKPCQGPLRKWFLGVDDRSPCQGETLKDSNEATVNNREQYPFAIGHADAERMPRLAKPSQPRTRAGVRLVDPRGVALRYTREGDEKDIRDRARIDDLVHLAGSLDES
jgi:hypothetical protein